MKLGEFLYMAFARSLLDANKLKDQWQKMYILIENKYTKVEKRRQQTQPTK